MDSLLLYSWLKKGCISVGIPSIRNLSVVSLDFKTIFVTVNFYFDYFLTFIGLPQHKRSQAAQPHTLSTATTRPQTLQLYLLPFFTPDLDSVFLAGFAFAFGFAFTAGFLAGFAFAAAFFGAAFFTTFFVAIRYLLNI